MQVRVIDGPLRDATFEPYIRLTIGRGCDCDIQLIHDGVSRRHACIASDGSGGYTLVDLESTNGTFIDSQRIDRVLLTEGTIFEIMRNRFIYERSPVVGSNNGVVSRNDGNGTHRTTIAYRVFGSKGSSRGEERHEGEASRRIHYQGDLVGDIAKYRSHRVRIFRSEPQSIEQVEVFEQLDQRMRSRGGKHSKTRRAFHRFSCQIVAGLRMFTGETLPVEVTDLGVDGARISVGSHTIATDTLLWLAIERPMNGVMRTLVFPGRAAWARGRYIGVSFAGAPGWSQYRSKSLERTHRELPPMEPLPKPEPRGFTLYLVDR